MTVGVIDYGMGNIRSVSNAIDYLGYEWDIVGSAAAIEKCSHIILPGVGAFEAAMNNLRQKRLVRAISEHCSAGRPFLGICLGMQLMISVGFEPNECAGINLIPGRAIKMKESEEFLLPHVGWNNLVVKRKHPVFAGIRPDIDFYFVHSFFVELDNPDDLIATSSYCTDFSAAIGRKNLVGIQFHPEKSQTSGLKLLENFCEWDGIC